MIVYQNNTSVVISVFSNEYYQRYTENNFFNSSTPYEKSLHRCPGVSGIWIILLMWMPKARMSDMANNFSIKYLENIIRPEKEVALDKISDIVDFMNKIKFFLVTRNSNNTKDFLKPFEKF